MTRIEALTLNLADDVLTEAEERELRALLAESDQARQSHFRILQIEAGLRAEGHPADLPQLVMARLRGERTESIVRGVMTQIKSQTSPELAREELARQNNARVLPLPFFNSRWSLRRAALALAACVAVLAGIGAWLLGPRTGQPVLTEITGPNVSLERGGKLVPALIGTSLHDGDTLRTTEGSTAVISFAPEETRVTILPGTEFTLTSLSRGKRFDLELGKLEASVARQRPFHPMILKTPHAEVRVIGTKFSLLTTPNATRLAVMAGRVRFTRLSDGGSVQVGAGNFAVAATNYVLAVQPLPGKVLREVWLDLPGDTLLDLRNHARFPNTPSERDFPPSFETDTNWPGAYGTRTRAYLLPPANGDYQFRLPDNVRNGQIRLMLSPDDDPADKLEICQIAFTRNRPGDQAPRRTSSQIESDPIHLDAGRKYYIEALHKFGTGEDRLSILWKRPDGVIEPIPSECLAPFTGDAKKEKR